MRKILIFLLVASLILGAASAVPRWGPPNGFYTKYLDADTITADVITSGVNITEDGAIGTDITLAADKFLKAATGTGYVDLSAATGVFKGPTGVFTPGGDISIPSSQAFNMGDGGATFGGLVTAANLKVNGTVYSVGALTSNALVTGANAKVNGTTYSVGALTTNALLTAANGKINGTLYTVGTVTGNGQVTGATIKANTSIYSAGTLNSAGTATLNTIVANTTVSAPADGIRANSIILPGEMVITVPITKTDFAAGELNRSIFIADDAWTITSVEEVHNVAEGTAATCTLAVHKMTGTQALTGGINITEAAFNLKGTANTVQTGKLSTTSGRTTLADGNRIGLLCNMTGTNAMNAYRGGVLTIHMKRI